MRSKVPKRIIWKSWALLCVCKSLMLFLSPSLAIHLSLSLYISLSLVLCLTPCNHLFLCRNISFVAQRIGNRNRGTSKCAPKWKIHSRFVRFLKLIDNKTSSLFEIPSTANVYAHIHVCLKSGAFEFVMHIDKISAVSVCTLFNA